MCWGAAAHEKNGSTTSKTKTAITHPPAAPTLNNNEATPKRSSHPAFPERLFTQTHQKALDNQGSFREGHPGSQPEDKVHHGGTGDTETRGGRMSNIECRTKSEG